MQEYSENIGKKVAKLESGKPFKSRLKVNTVKGILEHPILKIPAYTFEEDESYVECRRCTVLTEKELIMKYKIYVLNSPEHLQRTVVDGYHHKTIKQNVVLDLDDVLDGGLPYGEDNEFSSVEAAYEWAKANNKKYKLHYHKLIVLPAINLRWDEEV